jgi:D-glutamate cyclase
LSLIAQFDEFIRRDPARRGLIGSEPEFGPLCPGHLQGAAEDLARSARKVCIVTGFYIPRGEPPAAETDGPPGALLLANALRLNGIETFVATDAPCWSALCATAAAVGFPRENLVEVPHDAPDWRREFYSQGAGKNLSHLIAIERVGPSHTTESLSRQSRHGPVPHGDFESRVPAAHRDRCHNMRGEIIDQFVGDVHRLFEDRPQEVTTIGIGDGGNEIGMGVVPWEDLARRLSGAQAGRVPCRISADWNILAGTSNWGAQALAAAVLHLRGRAELLAPFDAAHEQRVLESMVANGPAVDGVTRRREPTVDGLPFLTYIQPWEGIRELLGLRR